MFLGGIAVREKIEKYSCENKIKNLKLGVLLIPVINTRKKKFYAILSKVIWVGTRTWDLRVCYLPTYDLTNYAIDYVWILKFLF